MWQKLSKNNFFYFPSSIILLLITFFFSNIFPYGKKFTEYYFSISYSLSAYVIFVVSVFVLTSVSVITSKIYKVKYNFWNFFTIYFYTLLFSIILYLIKQFYIIGFIDFPDYFLVIIAIAIAYNGFKSLTKYSTGVISINLAIIVIMSYIAFTGSLDVFFVYSLIFLLLFFFRKYFKAESFILIKRFKYGIILMNKFSKFKRTLKFLEFFSIIIAYIGMVGMAFYLFYNLYEVYFLDALPGISPVLPGVKIPGSPLVLPLWYGLISIFFAATIHEFFHGVFARLYKLKIKHTGFVMFGPFLGAAFVDIDEKQLTKAKPHKQLSVLSAGPFSNILTALIIFLVTILFLNPFSATLIEPHGVRINVIENSPAEISGLKSDMVITQINDQNLTNYTILMDVLNISKPNDSIILTVSNNPDPFLNFNSWKFSKIKVILGSRDDNSSRAYLGVTMSNFAVFKESAKKIYGNYAIEAFLIFNSFFFWFFIISIGLGVANLLPLGPVDGGRIMLVTLGFFMSEERAKKCWNKLSILFLFVIILILFSPMFV